MPKILPIRGLRFSDNLHDKMQELIAPPYDVINPEQQDELYQQHPYNIVNLELTKSYPEDDKNNNKYTRAADIFQEWLNKEILKEEKEKAIYLYEQHFPYKDSYHIRKGFFCALEPTPFEKGEVIPHEETLSKPKEDRLQLLRHCKTNFSPIFGLFRDNRHFVENKAKTYKQNQTPIIDFEDKEGQIHKIWAVTDSSFIKELQDFFQERKIYIADGHHRYETALQFYEEKKAEVDNPSQYAQALIAMVNIYDEGLLAFPTHRLITESSISSGELLEQLESNFSLKSLSPPQDKRELSTLLKTHLNTAIDPHPSFGLYTYDNEFYLLTLKDLPEGEKPSPWLDIVLLQELIFSRIFGIGEEERKTGSSLDYIKDEGEAMLQVDQGNAQYAFFLNKPPVEEILDLSETGGRMPQKYTFFYPKLATGLIMLNLGSQ